MNPWQLAHACAASILTAVAVGTLYLVLAIAADWQPRALVLFLIGGGVSALVLFWRFAGESSVQ